MLRISTLLVSESLFFGLYCGIAGLIIGFHITTDAIGDGWEWFPLYSGLSGFLAAFILWKIGIERPQAIKISKGVFIGILSALISHFLCWYLMIVISNVQHHIFHNYESSLGHPPMNPVEGLAAALVYGLFSLWICGWITLPVGGIIGGGYMRYLMISSSNRSKNNPA